VRSVFASKSAILVAAALVVFALPAAAQEEQWEKSYPFTARPSVRLESSDARIEVATWQRPEAHVRITVEGWRLEQDVRITESLREDRLEITVRLPRWRWGFSIGRRRVHIEMTIPADADLDVRTSDGRVSVADLAGHLRVRSSDGAIELSRICGHVELSSSDGRITGQDLEGEIDVTSSDGTITIGGRFTRVLLGSSDGRIDLTVEPGSKMESDWRIRSTDGRVTIALPRDFAARLDVATNDGRIHSELPITVSGTFGRDRLTGTLNGGDRRLVIRTTDGSVQLKPL
jgi:hypothetical protein